jgi:hypothetical protein
MRNLCRVIVLRSVHSLLKNSRMLLPMETCGARSAREAELLGEGNDSSLEYCRPSEKPIPDRYIRVIICDVAMLAQGQIRADALADRDLLAQVVRHKETFYPSGWARYDLAGPGSLRLVPVETRVAALERDYRNMGAMIFGDAPKFDWIMEALKALEREINR